MKRHIRWSDRIIEQGQHKGFVWQVIHNGIGYRCGYIVIPQDHPWHGRGYDHIEADVHGGLTYADTSGRKWRIGFDCAHAGDAIDMRLLPPKMRHVYKKLQRHGTVKTTAYVKRECRNLCQQAYQAWGEPRLWAKLKGK